MHHVDLVFWLEVAYSTELYISVEVLLHDNNA